MMIILILCSDIVLFCYVFDFFCRKAYLEFRSNKRQMKKQARKAEANQSLKRTLQAAGTKPGISYWQQ